MKPFDRLEVSWSGILAVVVKVLEQWQPPKLRGEIAFRNALFEHLKVLLPSDSRLEKEYRHHGTTSDLWLQWKGLLFSDELFFELKNNLNKKSEYDRLIGQIESLDPKKHKIVVVLLGESDPRLVARLTERYRDSLSSDDRAMAIVEIQTGA